MCVCVSTRLFTSDKSEKTLIRIELHTKPNDTSPQWKRLLTLSLRVNTTECDWRLEASDNITVHVFKIFE